MARVFFSYSHRDEELRNELETHLAALKRQGIIETWHDRRIGAGEDFENEISENLENADIILLLVSSDFIASEYCYGVEMSRAMERHRSGEAHVVPVILRPCLWLGLPFGRLQATPIDGKPVTKFPNQDDAFLEVTKAIHTAAQKLSDAQERGGRVATESRSGGPSSHPISGMPRSKIKPDIRSGNLRVKKQFTDHEKDEFLDDAFEYLANYFEGSLAELEKRFPEITTRFRRIDSNHFTATIYASGNLVSNCRIWMGGRHFPRGIAYSVGERGDDSSYNESLSVDDDGYTLFLRPLGMFIRDPAHQKLTHEGGAERFWSKLIEPLQRQREKGSLVANGSYQPGEGIHLKIRFHHGTMVKRIKATFVHEDDEDTKITLSGIPNKQREDEWVAILTDALQISLASISPMP